jgi:hypothetical protein
MVSVLYDIAYEPLHWSRLRLKWRTDLARFKVPSPAMDKLMHELVAECLVSLGDIYRTRQAALRV